MTGTGVGRPSVPMINGMRSPQPTARRLVRIALATVLAGTACSAPWAAAAPVAPLAWQPCGDGFDCATLVVPADHADPDGATVQLGLRRHRATDPERRIGSLLVNPGGPGVPAASMVDWAGPSGGPLDPELVARYDIVGMDPRGVGASGQVRCLPEAELEAYLALDRDPALPGGLSRAQIDESARRLADGCATGVDPALLGQLSTDVVARDMDRVRAALGEEQISYLGLSYGTLLGATYATLFPQRVRYMVLDAPVDPVGWRQDPLGALLAQTVSAEAMLNRWFETCAAEGAACPFGGGRPAEAFDALVARLEAQPLLTPPTGKVPAGRVDGAALLDAARTAVFHPGLWPVLTVALVTAENGDGRAAIGLGSALLREPDGSLNGLIESNLAINCMDKAVPADLAAHERNAEELRERAPRFGTQVAFGWLPCTVWPVQNADRFLDPLTGAGAPPILVIGGREDSQTPYPWALAMAGTLESGVLLTRDGVGHGSVGDGPCIDGAVTRHLTTGETPVAGTVCPQGTAPTTSPATAGG